MRMIVCVFLAMQLLLHQEALSCQDWEYRTNGECCPKCPAGSRVSKDCTSSSSTSCVPCSEGTYTDHPNGLTECARCHICDAGAHLKIKEECTYTRNTICSCKPGYFCSHPTTEKSCEMCTLHTVSPPGHKVIQAGTETNDTKFVPCPPGTFSATEMSFSCRPWTNCSKKDMVEVQPGSPSSDAVCEPQKPHDVTVLLAAILVPVLLLCVVSAVAVILYKQGKCTIKGLARKQKEEQKRDYIPVQETTIMAMPMQETALNLGEPSFGR